MRRLQSCFLLVFLTVLLLREISDPDIWMYLVVAREIVGTLTIPTHEFYLFPVLGEPATFGAIGYGLLHYFAYLLSGYLGMAVLNALLIAAALTILASVARARAITAWDWAVLLCVLAGAYACLNFRTYYRPESTLFLLMSIEILLLERWLLDGNDKRLIWLPLLAWGIAQLHTTAILLVLVYGAYVWDWAMCANWKPFSSFAWRAAFLATIGAAMLALAVVNPNGLQQLTVHLRPSSENYLVEYLPVWSTIYRWHFVALAIVAMASWVLSPTRRIVDALLLAGFGWLAFRYLRNLGLFALVCVVPVARTALYHAHRRTMPIRPSHQRWIAKGLMIVGAGALIMITRQAPGWGVGIRDGIFPTEAVAALTRLTSGGNVMNFYHLGGYLEWALGNHYRVAMDGHFLRPTYAVEYHDRIMLADPGWELLLGKHQVDAVVTPTILPFSGERIPLIERLVDDPRWRLVTVEQAALLFMRDRPDLALPALDKRLVWRHMQFEASIVLFWSPDSQAAREAIALANRRLNEQAGTVPIGRVY
jgi:hypothetical protein